MYAKSHDDTAPCQAHYRLLHAQMQQAACVHRCGTTTQSLLWAWTGPLSLRACWQARAGMAWLLCGISEPIPGQTSVSCTTVCNLSSFAVRPTWCACHQQDLALGVKGACCCQEGSAVNTVVQLSSAPDDSVGHNPVICSPYNPELQTQAGTSFHMASVNCCTMARLACAASSGSAQ